MTPEEAVKIVARKLVSDIVRDQASENWDCFPEIGLNDWNRVVDYAFHLADIPDDALHVLPAAYKLLEDRADRDV